jgi:transposase InsO family protein
MSNLRKFKDKYRYLLAVIDVFSKFLHIAPLRSKTGTAIASAFLSFLANYSHRRQIWLRTDRGKEFLNRSFQDMLKKEGIQFQVCEDPNVKCAIIERIERSHRTIRDKLYKYMTYKNTYRYIDVLPKFFRAYNDTVRSATGMAPSKVIDYDILAIWIKMRARHSFIRMRQSNLKCVNMSESLRKNSSLPRAVNKTIPLKKSRA